MEHTSHISKEGYYCMIHWLKTTAVRKVEGVVQGIEHCTKVVQRHVHYRKGCVVQQGGREK